MHFRKKLFIVILFSLQQISYAQTTLFTKLSAQQSGIAFNNKLVENAQMNIITYEYFYNGGGVVAADFNNDGLTDLYFTSNTQSNALYLNKGNMQFEDITRQSGTGGRRGWKTGVSVADVNADGFIDIYVCYSGDMETQYRKNMLLINNGNLTFTDKAEEMGIADMGHTTQAAFFDYDRDGDLDLFVLNHNIKVFRNFDAAFVKKMIDADAGDRLYENTNGKFTDVTLKAGIISNPIGYGLGIAITDINNDGWPDMYVTNDYIEEDYLYINNKNGTFTESLKQQVGHLSNFSMGVDIADVNNDGFMDIFTLDMLPKTNKRQKLLYAPDNYELYNNMVENGFYHQLMRNMLQLNNGNGTFSEIGQLSGVSNTDWSWCPLFADFNNDGNKDLLVTNGYGRDMINRDFMKFYANERLKHMQGKTDERMFQMLQGIKPTPMQNFIFENNGDLIFKDRSKEWGFDETNFTHGAVAVDLDNDGDLDIAANKMNEVAGIYKNNTIENKIGRNFLNVQLGTATLNTSALGAKVKAYTKSGTFVLERNAARGFQSSSIAPLHFTFPDKKIDSLIIHWPDGSTQLITSKLTINTTLAVNQAKSPYKETEAAIQPVFNTLSPLFSYTHKDEAQNDFKIQPLMMSMISHSGPRIAKADVNNDELEDIYICGAKNFSGELFIQQKDGSFIKSLQQQFVEDAAFDDCNAVFADFDNDKDADLYLVSGGFVFENESTQLQDRIYFNENGNFVKRVKAVPVEANAGSTAVPIDYDSDGDLDIFVGSRCIPGRYPEAPTSMLLNNDGHGVFTNVTNSAAPAFSQMGMITDALWQDINKDKKPELIIAGEWMPLMAFNFENSKFINVSDKIFAEQLSGFWNRLHIADIDNDGDPDLIAGNWGMNSQMQASSKEPVTLYYDDVDNNGFVDPIVCYYVEGKSYPMASRDEMTDQIISLRQKFPTYDSYSDATIETILNEEQLKKAKLLKADYLHTTWFENVNGIFVTKTLPIQANFSPVHAIAVEDFDKDGNKDILLGGNINEVRIKIGKMDAGYGTLLKGNGKGNFKYINQVQSGLKIKGCVKEIIQISNHKNRKNLLVGVNNSKPVFLSF